MKYHGFLVATTLALIFSSCETAPPPAAPAPKETLLDMVENQNLDKIRELFGLDQDVNSVNAQGQTALQIASARDLVDIAAVLLSRGAAVDQADKDGNTALHLAVKSGSSKVLPLLAQYGASLFSVDSQGKTVLQTALQQNPNLIPKLVTKQTMAGKDANGNTVLHIAAAQGLEKLVDILISLGADEQARNSSGLTALDEALQFPQSLPHVSIAWKLVREGAPEPHDAQLRYFWVVATANNVDQSFDSGQTGLHFAAGRGHLGILKLLLSKGANVNAADQPGNTPLHRAVAAGDLEAASLLVDQGANVDAKDFNSNTALHLAMTGKSPSEAVAFLLGKGANPNLKNISGDTPLHMVVTLGLSSELARLLVSRGADVDARNKGGNTSLLAAVKEQNRDLTVALLGLGASPFAINTAEESPLSVAIQTGTDGLSWLITSSNQGSQDDNGDTPLNIAVRMTDYPDAVNYLLSIGSNPNQRNKKGQGALHIALETKNLAISQALFKAGADLYLLDNTGQSPLALVFQGSPNFADQFFTPEVLEAKDTSRNTPLFHAVYLGNVPMTQLLLKKGASPKAQNLVGKTPLHEAVRLGSLAHAELLLKSGADVNQTDNQGNPPLHDLVQKDSVEMGELLLSHGANLGARNVDGRTVLQEAVRKGLTSTVAWLLKKGSNPNTRDNGGRTPLFDAVQMTNATLVGLLLNAGTGVNLRDASGSTVAHQAAITANQGVADLLLNAGIDMFAENASGTTPAVLALKASPESWKVFFRTSNINNQNNQGQTVLHLAVAGGVGVPAIQYLLSLNPDLQIRNKDGKTALDLAVALGRSEVVTVLKGKRL